MSSKFLSFVKKACDGKNKLVHVSGLSVNGKNICQIEYRPKEKNIWLLFDMYDGFHVAGTEIDLSEQQKQTIIDQIK